MPSIYAWPEDERPDLGFNEYLKNQGVDRPRRAGDLFAPVVDAVSGLLPGGRQSPQVTTGGGGAGVPAAAGGHWNRWTPSRLARIGGIGAGGLALGGILSAAGELANSDPTVTNAQKLGGAATAGLGSAGLGALGMALGVPLGPAGVIALGTLGSALGGQLGGLGRAAVGVFGPSELDKQISAYQRTAMAQADAEAYKMATLLPIQKQVADAALANQIKGAAAMAPIEAQRQRNAALAQSLLGAQQAAAAQSLAATNAIYGTVI